MINPCSWIETKPRPYWLLFLLAMAVAPAMSAQTVRAYQDAQKILIENEEIRITFHSENGTIDSVIHKRSGVDLLSRKRGAWPSLWLIDTRSEGDGNGLIQISQMKRFSSRATSDRDQADVDLRWKGLTLRDGRTLDNAEIAVRVTVSRDSPLSFWSFEYRGLDTLQVTMIRYPNFFGVGELGATGEDDMLLFPSLQGMLFHDPVRTLEHWWNTYPGGYASAQFFAFFDETSGFYIAAQDGSGRVKDLIWSWGQKKLGDRVVGIAHRLDGTEKGSFRLPYQVVLGATQGDWYAPAAQYRSWAVDQPWVVEARTKKTPSWLTEAGAMFTFSVHATPTSGWPALNLNYRDFLEACCENERFLERPVIGMLWGWEKDGSWAYGDYFPPSEGWKPFDNMIKELKPGRQRVFTYISPQFLTISTDLYRSGKYEDSLMLDENHKPVSPMDLAPGLSWAWMDVASAPWREKVVRDVLTLAQHGVHAVQLDGFPACSMQACSDIRHGHPPLLGGNWPTNAWIQLLRRIRETAGSTYPELALSGEMAAEPYLPYFHLYDSTAVVLEFDRTAPADAEACPVPLYEFLYHPYQVSFGKMGRQFYKGEEVSYLRLGLSRMLTWGQILDHFYMGLRFDDPAADHDAAAYFKAAVAARTTYARKYLVSGEMLPGLRISVPKIPVSFRCVDGSRGFGSFAAVQHSAWRAPDGAVGILLTNFAEKRIDVQLPLDFMRLGMDGGERCAVTLVGESFRRVVSTSAGDGYTLDLKLNPGQILLVELTR
jgi:hypothetical protein